MAENSGSSSTPWLAFLVGGLLVAVAVIAYFLYAGGGAPKPSIPESVNVDINVPRPPAVPDAPKLPDAPIPIPK